MSSFPAETTSITELSTAGRARSRRWQFWREGAITTSLVLCGVFSILTTFSIIFVLFEETTRFFLFETPVLETVRADAADADSETVPLEVSIQQVDGNWYAVLPDELSSIDLTAAAVRPSDTLILSLENGQTRSLTIDSVAPNRLQLTAESIGAGLSGTMSAKVARDEATVSDFFGSTRWAPLLGSEKHFGIWPLILGTLLVTVVAMLVALPLGFMTAMYLSEYAPRRVRLLLKPVLEVLAGVPTVVYGFFALTVITPQLRDLWDGFDVYNAASAGLAVGIMCLPIVTSLAEDSLRAVPNALREGAYGIGATKFEVTLKVVFPAALSGVIAASLLAVARAVGETMIVALAAGNLAASFSSFTEFVGAINPAEQTQTMTAYMVQIFLGDVSNFGVEYFSSYAVGFTLFCMTLILTLIGHFVRVKFREKYE